MSIKSRLKAVCTSSGSSPQIQTVFVFFRASGPLHSLTSIGLQHDVCFNKQPIA